MPTFFIVQGVKISLFFDDHNPPHFHALIAEYEAMVEIKTCKIIEGDLPNNKKKIILEWAEKNRDELQEIWEDLNK